MKFLFALLALTPLVYCATLTHEEQLIIQAMTNAQKRAILNLHEIFTNSLKLGQTPTPSLHDVKVAICKVISSQGAHLTCTAACPIALATIPFGEFAVPLCAAACNSISC